MGRSWGDFFKRVLGMTLPAIAGAAAVGVSSDSQAMPASTNVDQIGPRPFEPVTYQVPISVDEPERFAGHRSHSSHRSHASHASHYSSRGGGSYSAPSGYSLPAYDPPAASIPAPSAQPLGAPTAPLPPPTPEAALKPWWESQKASTKSKVKNLESTAPAAVSTSSTRRPTQTQAVEKTMSVQFALWRLGYLSGAIDGRMNDKTQEGLKAFQKDQGIPETGVMDNATLRRLGLLR